MFGSSHFVNDLSDIGAVIAFLGGLLLLAMTGREIKRARTSLNGAQAPGRVVQAAAGRRDRYGDIVAKVAVVRFTTGNGTRITFTENVPDDVEEQQKVTVHYNPATPRDTATMYPPRAAIGRVVGYLALSLLLILPFVGLLTLK